MKRPRSLHQTVRIQLTAILYLLCGAMAHATDTYNAGVLTMPSLVIGGATYSNVVISPITLQDVLAYTLGGTPTGIDDSYDPLSGELTIPAITVANTAYTNVIVSIPSTVSVSIGLVTGADSYSSGELIITSVQAGDTFYSDVVLAVSTKEITAVTGGMPKAVRDRYNAATGELDIPAVQVGNTVYTNVNSTVEAGNVVSVGGSLVALPGPNATLSVNSLIFACRNVDNAGCQCITTGSGTLSNFGTQALIITDLTITGPFRAGTSCGSSLAPAQACPIGAEWTETSGSGVFSIFDNAPGSPQAVSLNGIKECNPVAGLAGAAHSAAKRADRVRR